MQELSVSLMATVEFLGNFKEVVAAYNRSVKVPFVPPSEKTLAYVAIAPDLKPPFLVMYGCRDWGVLVVMSDSKKTIDSCVDDFLRITGAHNRGRVDYIDWAASREYSVLSLFPGKN